MKSAGAFFSKYWHVITGLVLLIIIIFIIYSYAKKAAATPSILSDTGGAQPSQADIDKANNIALRLQSDISGLNVFGHDDTIYMELAQSSNVVFALTLGKYKQLTGTSLISDINSETYGGWDVITVITNRANSLNLN